MRARVARAAAAAVLFLGIPATACSNQRSARPAEPTVAAAARFDPAATAVDIRAFGCRAVAQRGAGAVIGAGYILTAAHVVSGAASISVRAAVEGSAELDARLLAIDPVNDLALLGVGAASGPLAAGPGLSIADAPAAAGARGVAVVFRDDAATPLSLTIDKPVVVRMLDIHHVATVSRPGYEVQVPIEAGDSGAVMVDEDGDAFGVLFAKSRASDGRAFASDTSGVAALLAAADRVDRSQGIDTGECP